MHTRNETLVRAPLDACLAAAADVERWPDILAHYRRVRFLRRDGFGAGRVEMAAYRHFGPIPFPVWWVSEMHTDSRTATVRYRHVDGITRGMDVAWRLEETPAGTWIVIVHDWEGPDWPLVGTPAARRVIGPHFIHVVAGRTLDGIRRHVEAMAGPAAGPAAEGAAAETGKEAAEGAAAEGGEGSRD